MRLLIVRLGAIGDVIHTLPSLAAIRSGLPGCTIGWAVHKGVVHSLLQGSPDIDELYEFDLGSRDGIRNAVTSIRNAEFDVSLDFQGLLKSAMIPWLARVPRRIGFDFNALREPASGILLNDRVPVDDTIHIIEKNLTLVRALPCTTTGTYRFPIALSDGDYSVAARIRERVNGDFAILNPGGGWQTKLWDAEKYGLIADRLWREFGVRSLITYGPGEQDLAEKVATAAKTSAAVPVASSLKEFLALSRSALIFIGPDTGPMHLAAAARTPIVALFGSSSSKRNGPFDDRDLVVERHDLECRVNCYRRRCEHISCMDLPVEAVWATITRRLATLESPNTPKAPNAIAEHMRNWEVRD